MSKGKSKVVEFSDAPVKTESDISVPAPKHQRRPPRDVVLLRVMLDRFDILRYIVDAILALDSTIILEFTEEGLQIQGMDAAHLLCYEAWVLADLFDDYQLVGGSVVYHRICLTTLSLKHVLYMETPKDCCLVLSVHKKRPDEVQVQFYKRAADLSAPLGREKSAAWIRQVDPEGESVAVTDIFEGENSVSIRFPTHLLIDRSAYMSKAGDQLSLAVNNDVLTVEFDTDMTNYRVFMKDGEEGVNITWSLQAPSTSSSPHTTSTYLKCLLFSQLMRCGKGADRCILRFVDGNLPLKMMFLFDGDRWKKDGPASTLVFYLSPLIIDND